MKKLIFILGLILLPGLVSAAGTITIFGDSGGGIGSVIFTPANQTFISTTSVSGAQSGVGDLVWDMTLQPGDNRVLGVGCGLTNSESISTVSVGGFALTLATSNFSAASGLGTAFYYLIAPPVGAYSVDVQTTSGIMDRTICWAQESTGVNQSSPLDGVATVANSPGGGTTTVSLTTAFSHGIIMDVIVDGNADSPVQGASQTRVLVSGNTSALVQGSYKTTTSAQSYQMTWTSISAPTVQGAMAFKAAQ